MREKADDLDYTDFYYQQDAPFVEYLKTWGGTWEEYTPTIGQAQNDWNSFVNFVTSNNMALPANWAYVDATYNWKSLVDYIVLNSYVVTSDWLNWNTAWWRGLDTTGGAERWRYALWDNDATFGHYINYTGVPSTGPTADPCNPEQLNDPGGQGHIPVLNALTDNPIFQQYYISRFIDLNNTYFQCANMIAVLDSMALNIQPEMAAHCAKWGGSVSQWQGNVQALKTWIQTRCNAINQGLIDCYTLTGPYTLTVDVMPAGAGEVQVNSITPTNFAYNGTYFGGIDVILQATA